MSLKRRRESSFLLADVEPDIHIRVYGKDEPLMAHHDVLKLFSSIARDLPREANAKPTVWDLSQLVLEGESQPVSAELVQLWLDLLYARVDSSRRVALPTSLDAARPLLLFADAVGTGDALMQEIGSSLCGNQGLTLKVVVVDAGEVRKELQMRLEALFYCTPEGKVRECITPAQIRTFCKGVRSAAVQPAVASALEEWLALAGRLQLVPLVRKLMAFAKAQMVFWSGLSILGPAAAHVLSPRVLKLLPPEILYEAVAWRLLQPEPSAMVVKPCEGLQVQGLPLNMRCSADEEAEEEVSFLTTEHGRNVCRHKNGSALHINFSFGGPGRQELGELVGQMVQRAVEDDEAAPSLRQG